MNPNDWLYFAVLGLGMLIMLGLDKYTQHMDKKNKELNKGIVLKRERDHKNE